MFDGTAWGYVLRMGCFWVGAITHEGSGGGPACAASKACVALSGCDAVLMRTDLQLDHLTGAPQAHPKRAKLGQGRGTAQMVRFSGQVLRE
jgi:hypothetical protein